MSKRLGTTVTCTSQILMGTLLLSVFSLPTALAQDLRLEISVPKTEISKQEPVNLKVKLVNTSSMPYYVSGDMALGVEGIGHEFGTYRIQFRKAGASEFVSGPEVFADGIRRPTVSVSEFIMTNRLVLLRQGMFVGRTIGSKWDGLTLLEPGRYNIRMTYTSYGTEASIPKDLPFAIWRLPLISNVIDIAIKP